jgi:hypothetical protein
MGLIYQARAGTAGLVDARIGARVNHSNFARAAVKAMPAEYDNVVHQHSRVCLAAQATPPKPDIVARITHIPSLLKRLSVVPDFTRTLRTLFVRGYLPLVEIVSRDIPQNQRYLDCCHLAWP